MISGKKIKMKVKKSKKDKQVGCANESSDVIIPYYMYVVVFLSGLI